MNKDKWNSLPSYVQDGIMSVSGDVASELISECDHKNNQQVIDQILAEGKEIIYLSSNDKAKLTEAGVKMKEKQVAELEAKGLPARAVLNEILTMIKEYNQ
jgi:TRAP-type C4-dicarboxylate transport system substrate-binding protein